MEASHLIGWVLVVGAVGFGVGAGDPYLVRAWTAPQDLFLAVVARHPTAWRVTHLLFIGGTALTVAGLVMVPALLPSDPARVTALAGAIVFAIAAILWTISLVYRLAVTPAVARTFVTTGTLDPTTIVLDQMSAGLFRAFMVLAFCGLAAIGIASTFGGPIPAPIGWGTALLGGLAVVGLILAGDMPPFTVYLPPLAFGVALLINGSSG